MMICSTVFREEKHRALFRTFLRRRFLAFPHGTREGTRMPDVLAGLDAGQRDEATEDLVQFLLTLGGPIDATP